MADASTKDYESLSRALERCNNQLHPQEIEDELSGLMVAGAGSDFKTAATNFRAAPTARPGTADANKTDRGRGVDARVRQALK